MAMPHPAPIIYMQQHLRPVITIARPQGGVRAHMLRGVSRLGARQTLPTAGPSLSHSPARLQPPQASLVSCGLAVTWCLCPPDLLPPCTKGCGDSVPITHQSL